MLSVLLLKTELVAGIFGAESNFRKPLIFSRRCALNIYLRGALISSRIWHWYQAFEYCLLQIMRTCGLTIDLIPRSGAFFRTADIGQNQTLPSSHNRYIELVG